MQITNKQYFLAVAIVVISTLASFYSGFFLKDMLVKESDSDVDNLTNSTTPVPYLTDQIVIITKDKPHRTLYGTAIRFSRDWETYTHRQRAFYFDGEGWSENFDTTTSDNFLISNTSIFPEWNVVDDQSFVLKQSIKGVAIVNNNQIEFDIPLVENEMGVRSLVGYTLFRSETSGRVKINGVEHNAHILYERMYSLNVDIKLVATSNSNKISTDWVAFWDEDGNFYNTDETIVTKNDEDPYKSHSIAITKDSLGRILKSYDLQSKRFEDSKYEIKIEEPVNKDIIATIVTSFAKNSTNKDVNNKIGLLDGHIKSSDGKTIKGIGFYEYIDQ